MFIASNCCGQAASSGPERHARRTAGRSKESRHWREHASTQPGQSRLPRAATTSAESSSQPKRFRNLACHARRVQLSSRTAQT